MCVTSSMHQIILASQSPRRLHLLEEAGFVVTVKPVKLSERIDKNLTLEAAIEGIARAKVEACCEEHNLLKQKDILVIGADTLVVHEAEALGKPKNLDQARVFLARLSQNMHSVITGVCIYDGTRDLMVTRLDTTQVEFRKLDPQEIEDYVLSGEPMDKAGAYAIQGQGGRFVKSIRGSWSNVVGLPMELLVKTFNEYGWRPLRKKLP